MGISVVYVGAIEISAFSIPSQKLTINTVPSKWYLKLLIYILVHTYRLRFILEGVAEASQIFFQDAHVLPK
jgi:hypothetical protein